MSPFLFLFYSMKLPFSLFFLRLKRAENEYGRPLRPRRLSFSFLFLFVEAGVKMQLREPFFSLFFFFID